MQWEPRLPGAVTSNQNLCSLGKAMLFYLFQNVTRADCRSVTLRIYRWENIQDLEGQKPQNNRLYVSQSVSDEIFHVLYTIIKIKKCKCNENCFIKNS